MKNLYMMVFFIIMLTSVSLSAQAEEWLWARGVGGTGGDATAAIDTDSAGNSYVAGYFHRTVNFGSLSLTTLNTAGTAFVGKVGPTGAWNWVKKIENDDTAAGTRCDAVAADMLGNVYVTGAFNDYIIVGDTTLFSNGGTDIFLAKLDSNGNWLWASNIGSVNSEYCNDIVTDSESNLFLTGKYTGPMSIGSTQLTYAGWGSEMFVAKMGSNGAWLWATQSGGTCEIAGESLDTDLNGNVYVTGSKWTATNSIATFGSFTVANVYPNYIAMADSNGNWIWAVGSYGNVKDLKVDAIAAPNPTIYITGGFSGTQSFGSQILTSVGDYDMFVAKLSYHGNWLWARRGGGSSQDFSHSVVLSNDSSVYLSGFFAGNSTWGIHSLTSYGSSDAFVAKLDASGNWLWVVQAGGVLGDYAEDASIDSNNNVYVTGTYYSNATYGVNSIFFNGSSDFFISKIGYPQIEAAFIADALTGIQPYEVHFTDQSQQGSGPITTWFWDFGDGNTSNTQNPVHTYLGAGVFDVSLTVINTSDSISTLVREDYITVIDDDASIQLLTSDQINFGSVYIEELSSAHNFTFKNNGSQPLIFTNIYLLGSPVNFQYQIPGWNYIWQPGETSNIYFRFAPQEVGAITDTLVIVNNSANMPLLKIKLIGTGLYVPLEIPTNVAITMDANNAIVDWDPVTENLHGQPITPDYYFVWFNGLSSEEAPYYFLAPVTGTTYTHVGVALGAQYMFYRVTAVKFYRDDFSRSELDSYLKNNITPGMSEADVRASLKQF